MQSTQSQDRIAGMLAYIIFFIPILMDRRTEYTCFHMKQAFLIFVVAVFSGFIPFFGGLIGLAAFVHIIFMMWKAYNGEKFVISYIYPYSERLITLLQVEQWFIPKK